MRIDPPGTLKFELKPQEQRAKNLPTIVELAGWPTATITIANIDSEIGRKLGMEKGKKYVIALLGEAE